MCDKIPGNIMQFLPQHGQKNRIHYIHVKSLK